MRSHRGQERCQMRCLDLVGIQCRRILWTEEPGGLLSIGSHRVGHGWSDLACVHACIGEGNGNPLQYSCLENPVDRGAWWAAVHRVAQSQTWLKWLCMHALEKEMATHSSILAWRIPGTEKPGGLPSMGSHRDRHDWNVLVGRRAYAKILTVVFFEKWNYWSF